jgi:5-formyltetrahydrofolate cyclo-ligase
MPATQKKRLRLLLKERRSHLFQENPTAGDHIANLFFDLFDFPQETIIGGYWSIGSELDLKPLLRALIEKGFRCALPCICQREMIFRLWNPSEPLVQGAFHIFEPSETALVVLPNVLLVPLLAFDKTGHRLGYGQGHYDKFLHQHKVITIGIGFKGQEIKKIPHQPHDFALDYILTEQGLIS